MFHLLLTVCIEAGPCAERWLPAADRATRAACEAAAPPVIGPWTAAHGLTPRRFRCTEALPPPLPLEPVARGVWVHRGASALPSPENHGEIANLGVIEALDAMIVVDPGGSRAQAERLLSAIRNLSDKPVAAVIVTHHHPDHSLGTAFFAEAGATIIAHERLPAALAARTASYATTYRDSIGAGAWLGSGFVLPDVTVSAPETREIGGTALRLTPVQPAHTDSDLTVLHVESGTLFTGDLAFRELAPVLEGSITGWLGWLDLPEPEVRVVVPGHGPVATDWQEATGATRGYLEALAGAVRLAIGSGLGLGEAIPAVVAAMAPQADAWADFDTTTRRNAAAAYQELEWE